VNTEENWEHPICLDFRNAYGSVRFEILCKILIEFDVAFNTLRLIKCIYNKVYSNVPAAKHLSCIFIFRTVDQLCIKVFHKQDPRKSGGVTGKNLSVTEKLSKVFRSTCE
jgi:hypothetical protein